MCVKIVEKKLNKKLISKCFLERSNLNQQSACLITSYTEANIRNENHYVKIGQYPIKINLCARKFSCFEFALHIH